MEKHSTGETGWCFLVEFECQQFFLDLPASKPLSCNSNNQQKYLFELYLCFSWAGGRKENKSGRFTPEIALWVLATLFILRARQICIYKGQSEFRLSGPCRDQLYQQQEVYHVLLMDRLCRTEVIVPVSIEEKNCQCHLKCEDPTILTISYEPLVFKILSFEIVRIDILIRGIQKTSEEQEKQSIIPRL